MEDCLFVYCSSTFLFAHPISAQPLIHWTISSSSSSSKEREAPECTPSRTHPVTRSDSVDFGMYSKAACNVTICARWLTSLYFSESYSDSDSEVYTHYTHGIYRGIDRQMPCSQ